MSQIKVSDYIAEFLQVQEISHVFEVAGGMITHMLDSLHRLGSTQIISVHHEQAAAFAADAYGRCKGRPGVAFATSGPGATNLLTGIASCYFDSSPGLFITGQVNTHEQKGERGVRQLGFQETDIVSMAKPITKKCYSISDASQVVPTLNQAYVETMKGRPGPVLIDIAMDVQRAKMTCTPINYLKKSPGNNIQNEDIEILSAAIKKSERPLILAGNGISCAGAKDEFLRFVEMINIPVVTSLLAVDVIAFDHPLRAGFIGTYGNRWANMAIGKADLLIVMGSRLDIRQTGADVASFQQDKVIIHIDCDESEINNRIKNCIPIISDQKLFLTKAIDYFSKQKSQNYLPWKNEILKSRNQWPDVDELKNFDGINPNSFMHQLSKISGKCRAWISDVGSHQMWAAQSLEIQSSQQFLTSGGLGAMGFALPAAIGASFALDKKPVIAIIGDGAFQMNIQELQTIVRNKLPICIVVMNNKSLGMIRQFQDSYFAGRHQSTSWGYSVPDFQAIAKAYGIFAQTVFSKEDLQQVIAVSANQMDRPQLLQVMIDTKVNVYPKIAFGRPVTEMEPFSKPIEIEST